MFKICWNNQEAPLHSLQAVEELLDQLELEFIASKPTLVTVELEDGDSLSIGLGKELSVLNFVAANNDPPYFTSAGNLQLDGVISFCYEGELSEFPLKHAVTNEAARAAITHFCLTGKLTSAIKWEEV